jgi:hypothetical protein
MAGVSGVGIHELAERAGLNAELVKVLVEEITAAIIAGERVKLRGLGSFEARDLETDGTRASLVKFNAAKPLRAALCLAEEAWHASRIEDAPSAEEE